MTRTHGTKDKKIILSDNSRTVLERRYLKKDDKGDVCETPENMFRRVARHISLAEKNYDESVDIKAVEDKFYDIMTGFKFLPNSPTLMNAGRDLGQLAACFVLPVEDSMEAIFETLKNAALIHKSGGGTGFSFSRLRPKNSKVGSTGGVASGPVSFMQIFNTATEQVKQGGTRRGANMAILRVDHPDILEFIRCKNDKSELNNFNISVGVTDKFMQAVSQDSTYELLAPDSKTVVGTLNAADVYAELVKQAWETGDPGIIFLDEINRGNTTPELGEMESTNPCGEQPLLPMEACNLGSINLVKFIIEEKDKISVDYEALRDTVHWAVRFLDNAIDMSIYPITEIEKMVKSNRKIGLGVMGFADMLFMLNIPYSSDAAIDIAEEVMAFVQKESHEASKGLAAIRGVFPNYDGSVFSKTENNQMRNATTTTIAPTGTLSIIAGCSSGIEPVFALSFVRNVMDKDKLVEVNPIFEKTARAKGFYSENMINSITEHGTVKGNMDIPITYRKVFVSAHEIEPKNHVMMQAAFQKHTDNAVSKTVNLSKHAAVEDVKHIYDLAHELKCKGVTIYRDGSKDNQVLSLTGKAEDKETDTFIGAVKDRPETLEGFTTKIKTGMGYLYVTVSELEGKPFEIFATIGKSGKSTTAKTEAIGRLISLALRSGVNVEDIINQIKGIGGEHAVFQKGGMVLSIPDAIGRVLETRYFTNEKGMTYTKQETCLKGNACPECGQPIAFEEGCMTCHSCGYTKCG